MSHCTSCGTILDLHNMKYAPWYCMNCAGKNGYFWNTYCCDCGVKFNEAGICTQCGCKQYEIGEAKLLLQRFSSIIRAAKDKPREVKQPDLGGD
jgi:hypothetical protein